MTVSLANRISFHSIDRVDVLSTTMGSAEARIGNTLCLCGIKAEIAEPLPNQPSKGIVVPNIDFPAVSSSQFKPGPPSELAQRMTEAIHQILIRSIDVESLCIQEKQAVWVLYVDIVCLSYDGNAFDAACLSMVAALKDTRLPSIQHDDGIAIAKQETFPLKLLAFPLSITYESDLSLVFDEHEDLYAVFTWKGTFTKEFLQKNMPLLKSKVLEFRQIL